MENLERLPSLSSESSENPLRQIEPALRQRLVQSLEPGEEIVWAGKPIVELAAVPKAWNDPSRLNNLRLIAAGFIITVVAALIFSGFDWKAVLFLSGFYLFATLFGVFGDLLNPTKHRQKQYERWSNKAYVLTNRRIFVVDNGKNLSHTSLKNLNLNKEKLSVNPDGSGSLTYKYANFDDGSDDGVLALVGFEYVPNVQQVRRKLHQVLGRAG